MFACYFFAYLSLNYIDATSMFNTVLNTMTLPGLLEHIIQLRFS